MERSLVHVKKPWQYKRDDVADGRKKAAVKKRCPNRWILYHKAELAIRLAALTPEERAHVRIPQITAQIQEEYRKQFPPKPRQAKREGMRNRRGPRTKRPSDSGDQQNDDDEPLDDEFDDGPDDGTPDDEFDDDPDDGTPDDEVDDAPDDETPDDEFDDAQGAPPPPPPMLHT
eukprot:3230863-Prymnesium_polylepis.1